MAASALLLPTGATSPTLTALLGRAAAAEQELRAAPGPVEGAQRAVEAHQQLVVLQAVLAARREGQWLDVLRVRRVGGWGWLRWGSVMG